MARYIAKILRVEHRKSIKGAPYFRTIALLDDGTEANGYGRNFKAGDQVECFFHEPFNTIKFRHLTHKST